MAVTLDSLFQSYAFEAFRVEGRTSYGCPEDARALAYFREHDGEVPADFGRDWMTFLRESKAVGKTVRRLRLVSEPLTEYERFELHAHRVQVAAGEQIKVDLRSRHPYGQDFWLFDRMWCACLDYDDSGASYEVRLTEVRVGTEPLRWVERYERAQRTPEDVLKHD